MSHDNPERKLVQQVLPEYTTERYYVLSEIEQASKFESEEGGDAEDGVEAMSTASKGMKKHFYYMLWNAEIDGIENSRRMSRSSVVVYAFKYA